MFNAVEFIHRLEKAGLGRQAIEERNARIATPADIEKLERSTRAEIEKLATKDELAAAL